jgi:glycosyltransferase involved in cell wall biosynthesis
MTASAPTPPRHVLLVIRWPVGGIRTFVRYVFRNFDPQRWRFTILAPVHVEMQAMLADLSSLDIRHIPLEERPSVPGFFRRVAIEIFRGGYDLVHSQGFTSGMAAALPAFLRRTPHLMTSHDVINPGQFAGRQGRLKRWGMARLFAMIDRIHSVSHDAQANLLEYFPGLAHRDGQCVVIPNGIEVERFLSAQPKDLRKDLGLAPEVFLIGFFGRFMKQKGFRYLVDAVDLLRQRQDLPRPFLVLTYGWGGFIREEQQTIRDKGLEPYFRFMPFTDNVAGVIKGLDVVVMPSLWESCGLLAMETLTCGTPFIGTDCIGLREVLKDTPASISKSRDEDSLAKAIERQLCHQTKSLQSAFSYTAALRFDAKIQSLKIQELYVLMEKTDWNNSFSKWIKRIIK